MDLRTFIEPQQGTTYDEVLAHARTAQRLGFDAWFTSDHLLGMGGVDPRPGPTDAWTTLAGLARDTSTIRLGTLVTPATFRAPGHFAVQAAQVDAMSGGRIEVGFGAGWYEDEHRAMSIPFPDLGDRMDRREEYVEIVTTLWELPDGERWSFGGEHYTIEDNPGLPKPAQSPHPPVIIGGAGRSRTPRLAARYATEWNVPFPSPGQWAELAAIVRAACEDVDRDPDDLTYSVAQVTCIGADEDEFRERAAAIGRDPDELRANGVCGLPEEARERVERFAEEGCERIYLQTLDIGDLDHLQLIADTLRP
jgi:F420-dependent oxidoreductase-like protein